MSYKRFKCPVQVLGEGPKSARVVLVGEAPGKEEVAQGRPFVGRAGRFLTKLLGEIGIDRQKLYITNVVKFRPTRVIDGKIKDRKPTKAEIEVCLPILKKELEKIKPKMICLLGDTAIKALAGNYSVLRDHGKIINHFLLTCHPAMAMRNRRYREFLKHDLEKLKVWI